MTKPADSKQAIPSPEDRVRAMKAEELLQKIEAAAWVAGSHDEFDYDATDLRAELLSRLSLVEELKGQVAAYKKADELNREETTHWQAEADLLRKRKDYHAEYVEAVEAAEKAKRERDEYLETGQRIQGDFERAKEAYVCSERELGVMREALRKIGDPGAKVDSLMEARMIARAALTPEPASQAAKEKP